jgi:hypothetical protein
MCSWLQPRQPAIKYNELVGPAFSYATGSWSLLDAVLQQLLPHQSATKGPKAFIGKPFIDI